MSHSAAQVAAYAQLACLLEVSAPKPGNVSPAHTFRDSSYEDFLASAIAIGPAFAGAGSEPLGKTICAAVEATRRWTRANTNLGLVLLLAPLARAALISGADFESRVERVLLETTVTDACDVYAAIRLANPGGLGTVAEQDVRETPSVTLVEAMALARERDAIAREYVTRFATTFGVAVPALERARRDGLIWRDAIVETYLTLLAAEPDTLILRKRGARARDIQLRARTVLDAGGVRQEAGRHLLAILDRDLRDLMNQLNPGSTADLTGAAIFVVLLEGGFRAAA
ncbi:MAG TPA: triphosphoribosyl-dephospho-CoA synthase [Gemmatimonadales bacterium]|nr:triphosphoribosyl-dephospho-CoA synthase [Gemmatimonadales bacterium]